MDDDFEDLLGGRDGIGQDSSQESLTTAAAGLDFCERGEELLDDGQTPPQSTFDYGGPVGLVVETDLSVAEMGPSGKGKRRNPRSINTTPGSAIDRAGQEITSDCSDTTPSTKPPDSPLGQIEAVFEQIADDMIGHTRQIGISLDVRPRVPPTRSSTVADAITLDRKTRRLGFPGETAEEAWRFSKASSRRAFFLLILTVCSRYPPHPRADARSAADGRHHIQAVRIVSCWPSPGAPR